ncbi:hypothetical protein NQ038_08305 [Brevibacterium sp. 50QC2O2]|uniref:hypothetical protein n=1 Tax=Brevibacterium sp. 50QC2O2 TaxID=2968459 RepID=UPI00211C30C8|nr:hypothetical protein [Brevibacterium sp. 50QC2O2]MCQ9388647.1 hypothetical protein [Brevibacterium sp. 50QC2O2]
MTVFMLERGNQVRIRAGRLTLTAGLPTPAAQLRVTDPAGAPVQMHAPTPGVVVLPQVAGGLRVGLVDPAGEFPVGSRVHLKLESEPDGAAGDSVHLAEAIDVSGVTSADLITADLIGAELVISLAAVPVSHGTLTDLASRARAEVRAQSQDAPVDPCQVAIVVDGSESFAAVPGLDRVLEILSGVASVVSDGRPVQAALASGRVDAVPVTDLAALPADVLAARRAQAPHSIFAAEPAVAASLPGAAAGVVYIVSDAPPADHAELAAARRADGIVRHPVVLEAPRSWAVESQGLDLPDGATVVDLPDYDAQAESGRAQMLREIVGSLLDAVRAVGRPPAAGPAAGGTSAAGGPDGGSGRWDGAAEQATGPGEGTRRGAH